MLLVHHQREVQPMGCVRVNHLQGDANPFHLVPDPPIVVPETRLVVLALAVIAGNEKQ